MRSLVKTLVILSLAFIALIILANIVRILAFEDKPDPIEAAVSKALGNENLVLGSRLRIWVQYLGEPDLIANCENVFNTVKLFWLKKGVGVQVDGHADTNLNALLNERVNLAILPVRKKSAPVLMRGCRFVGDGGASHNEIEFENLLDVKVYGSRISGMKESDIRKLYQNYDASNDYYYNSSFPFNKDTVRLIRYPDPDCAKPCGDEINTMLITSSTMFSVAEAPRFLKRLFLFPYLVLSSLLEHDA